MKRVLKELVRWVLTYILAPYLVILAAVDVIGKAIRGRGEQK